MKYVLIVDDQRMPRENMERIINESEGYQLVMSLSAAEFAPLQCERSHVDLVLMDVCTDGSMDGIDAAAVIKKKVSGCKGRNRDVHGGGRLPEARERGRSRQNFLV